METVTVMERNVSQCRHVMYSGECALFICGSVTVALLIQKSFSSQCVRVS